MFPQNTLYGFWPVVGDFVSPSDGIAEQTATQNQIRTRKPRPTSWHNSSSTYKEKEQLSRIGLLESIDEQPLQRQKSVRRGRDLPPLPEGEHSVAARSRIRHKAERRRSRSTQRREDVNPTQSIRSSRRRDSSVSSTRVPQLPDYNTIKTAKQKNRRSTPLPASTVTTDALRKLKQNNRRSAPLPLRLPIIPASPAAPLFRDPWLEDTYRELTGINQPKSTKVDNLISPKTRVVKPALLSGVPAKSTATTCTSNLTALRRPTDLSNVPMSAPKHSWGMFIDERPPLLLHYFDVLRRPSSAWTVDTHTPTATTFAQAGNARQLESRGWNEDMRGTRMFNESGYWVAA